jgi:hypothetical protein
MAYIYDLTDTWNAGGTTFNAIKMNVTDSASASASKLVTLQTNGTEHFSVTKGGQGYFSGNVGIGTASPSAKLHVVGGTSTLKLTNTTVADFSGIEFTDGTNTKGQIWVGNGSYGGFGGAGSINYSANSGPHVWLTNYVERMRIDSSGNLGVGTSSPLSATQAAGSITAAGFLGVKSYLSSHQADVGVIEYNSGKMTLRPYGPTAGTGYLAFNTGGGGGSADTERMRITSGGDVGIGTTSPSTKLDVTLNSGGYWTGSGWSATPTAVTVTNTTSGGYDPVFIGRMTDSGGTSKNAFAIGAVGTNSWTAGNDGTQTADLYFAVRNTTGGIAEHMRIRSSGNVGIGTSSPSVRLHAKSTIAEAFRLETASARGAGNLYSSWYDTTGRKGYFGYGASDDSLFLANETNAPILFLTNSAERARIDSSGNLLVGTASTAMGQTGIVMVPALGGQVGYMLIGHANGTASGNGYMEFGYNASTIGSITQSGTTAVAYNTSSDYRLKNIDGPIINSGSYIDALKPVQGSWKSDGSRFIGLLAHEVQEVSETPIATGEKDGEKMQAMDYSAPEIIANLIAEIQSLRQRVAQLEGN